MTNGYIDAAKNFDKCRIQILAAISGREDAAMREIEAVTKALREAGHYVVSPFEICQHINRNLSPNGYWMACMHECLNSLCCNSIDLALAINDISGSIGAQIEIMVAKKFNITTYQRYGGLSYLPYSHSAAMIARVLNLLEGNGVWQAIPR